MFTGHLVRGVRNTYSSAMRDYAKFTLIRGLPLFPADGLVLAAWMYRMASYVKPSSMNLYLAAVRHHQELEGVPWALERNHYVGCAKRYLKRRFPTPEKAAKFPVTLSVLKIILPCLPGWPDLGALSHEDRLFACASILAVMGFLRGGEFLSSPGSVRPILKLNNLSVETVRGQLAVVMHIPQPKARFWLCDVRVPCYHYAAMGPFSPVGLWQALLRGSPALKSRKRDSASTGLLPAFHFKSGSALSKLWMLKRTRELCGQMDVSMSSQEGAPLSLRAASWRAGGVRSAVDAGQTEEMIMKLGRWKSNAWLHYLLHTTADVQGAARSMWGAPHREESATRSMGNESSARRASDRTLLAGATGGTYNAASLHGIAQQARTDARVHLHLPSWQMGI
jgi:hypothetical protein